MCTMKCPRCGQTATKAKPQDQFYCGSCGWRLTQLMSACESASPYDSLRCDQSCVGTTYVTREIAETTARLLARQGLNCEPYACKKHWHLTPPPERNDEAQSYYANA